MSYIENTSWHLNDDRDQIYDGSRRFDITSTGRIYCVAGQATGIHNTSTNPFYGYVIIRSTERFSGSLTIGYQDGSTSTSQIDPTYDTTMGVSWVDGGTITSELIGQTNPNQRVEVLRTLTDIPIFDVNDTESIENFIETGDDSGALNNDYLHSAKTHIYCSNNGDRITFKSVPIYKGGDKKLAYNDIWFRGSFSQIKMPLVGEVSTSWDKLDRGLTTLEGTLIISKDNTELATFSIKLTRKLLGIFGDTTVSPEKAENNGYLFSGTSDNQFDDVGEDSTDNSDSTDNPSDGSNFGGFSNLCASYKITKQALNDLGNFIWNNNIFDNIKLLNTSPIENLVSLMYMPIDIGGINQKITLGNIETNVSGSLLTQNMKKINVATFTIPYYNTGFLNFEPYTSVALYLPLVGMVSLQPRDVVGYTISIDYAFDIVVGSFGVYVYTSKGGGKTLIYSSQGTCSITIPLTASNQAQVQASILQSGVGLASNIIEKDVVGSINSAMDIATTQNHSSTFGSASSMVGALSPSSCYYIIRTPIVSIPSTFAHTYGWVCMQSFKLSEISGYTEVDQVDLTGLYAMNEELNELESILKNGFYI